MNRSTFLFLASGGLSLTSRACRARLTTTAMSTVSAEDLLGVKQTMSRVGVPLSVAPTNVNGGTTAHTHFTMPDATYLDLVSGNKYELNGVIYVRAVEGVTPIQVGVRSVTKLVLAWSGTAWDVRRDGQYMISNRHANFADYFAADADFPDIEDDNGALSLLHTGVGAVTYTVEADFTIADLGADS